MEIVGYGTERLEDEVAEVFPGRKILRMDLDTTRNKEGYSRIIDEFSAHKADILVGTQMVTKGLDFGDVELVGVLNADTLLNFPDFRSAERAFNMLEQIAVTPPPSNKGKFVKIKYITMLKGSPVPTFIFFCNLPQWVKEPYRRYLENKIREHWTFTGTPINIFMREK